jgi:hypothetical protein
MNRIPGSILAGILLAGDAGAMTVRQCDVLVIGGSASGVAASLAAAKLGKTVCLVESTRWLGGQFLTVAELDELPPAGVPPDHVSQLYSLSYQTLRFGIQNRAALQYDYEGIPGCVNLPPPPFDPNLLSPGMGTTNILSYPPHLAMQEIQSELGSLSTLITQYLNYHVTSKLISADGTKTTGAQIAPNRLGPQAYELQAKVSIDATEFGDFIVQGPAPALPSRIGVDAQSDTNETDAPTTAVPACLEPLTYPIFLERLSSPGSPTIPRPADYDASLYGLTTSKVDEPDGACAAAERTLWNWRRTIWPPQFALAPLEQTQFMDPAADAPPTTGGNDFNRLCLGNTPAGCEPVAASNRAAVLARGANLASGYAYWIQTTQAPHSGTPLQTQWRMAGTETAATFGPTYASGVAPIPYVRESRRLKAITTIREDDLSQALRPGATRARLSDDSLGIGNYAFDLHHCAGGDPVVMNTPHWFPDPLHPEIIPRVNSLPFQIPLGAMVPAASPGLPTEGFLAAGKNLGVTHISNGAYRLQPVEWHIGLAAGAAAAASIDASNKPLRDYVPDPDPAVEPQFGSSYPGITWRPHHTYLRGLQQTLVRSLRDPLYWWTDVFDNPIGASDPAVANLFEATQMTAADQIFLGSTLDLNFNPGTALSRADGAIVILRTIHSLALPTVCTGTAFLDVPCPGLPISGVYAYVQPLKIPGVLDTTNPSEVCALNGVSVPINASYYQPGCTLTRRDFARFLLRGMGFATSNPPSPHFSDVPTSDLDYIYIEGAYRWSFVDVPSGGPFRPNDPVTRGEAALMTYNAIKWYYGLAF